MLFKQLLDQESCTLTYLLADLSNKEAVFIDPVDTQMVVYLDLLKQYGVTLKYSLETHVHADHITASGQLRQKLGAKTAVSSLCGASTADIQTKEGDIFEFGANETIHVIATPGHTVGSISLLWRDCVFTGDALLIDGCGRTDFQGGNPGDLYDSVTQKLFTLPAETLVYPGHDYHGRRVSNIAQERTTNARLSATSRAEFITTMNNLNLPKPKLIAMAVPANRYCGIDEAMANQAVSADDCQRKRQATNKQDLIAVAKQKITEIEPAKAQAIIAHSKVCLIDVREAHEFNAGHIDNAILIPRGVLEFSIAKRAEITSKSSAIIVYCGSGGRAALAANTLMSMGYTNVMSIAGGYKAWKQQG